MKMCVSKMLDTGVVYYTKQHHDSMDNESRLVKGSTNTHLLSGVYRVATFRSSKLLIRSNYRKRLFCVLDGRRRETFLQSSMK